MRTHKRLGPSWPASVWGVLVSKHSLKRRPGRGTSPGRKRHLYSSSLTSALLTSTLQKRHREKGYTQASAPTHQPLFPFTGHSKLHGRGDFDGGAGFGWIA